MTYMLDTNICIYAMKNKPENVLQRLKKELNSGVCISSITLAVHQTVDIHAVGPHGGVGRLAAVILDHLAVP